MSQAPRRTILVVEDDATIRMLIVDVLEELEYHVIEAGDGPAALALLEIQAASVDLMMTDIGLPVMDGIELAERVAQRWPALPVLFASGYNDPGRLPADAAVIGKPFSIDQLRDKVGSFFV